MINMMNKTKTILGKLFAIFSVPKDVYEYKTADTDFESIKKDWEAILGPAENWSKYEKK